MILIKEELEWLGHLMAQSLLQSITLLQISGEDSNSLVSLQWILAANRNVSLTQKNFLRKL